MQVIPKVSFIMPTRNAAGIVENCLRSIVFQDYPKEFYEIIIVDAHSLDGTREVAARYGAVIIDDTGWDMENAKRQALAVAKGEFVVFVDADNEIAQKDYVRLAVKALQENEDALGVEAYYFSSSKMTSFCAYLTCLLHISDPVCWLMSVKPVFCDSREGVEKWAMPSDSLAYPLGANGFVYRKTDLDSISAAEKFSDTHIAILLIKSGKEKWLRLSNRGVCHYYVAGPKDFLKKRQRATCHYFNIKRLFKFTWTEQKPRVPGWLACFYGISFIGPFFHMLLGFYKDRDWRWVWHPIASFLSTLGVMWGTTTYFLQKDKKQLVASLQPRQTTKSEEKSL